MGATKSIRQVTAAESPGGIAVFSIRGFATRATVDDAIAASEAVMAEREVKALVFDLLTLDGFEPGIPMKVIAWLGTRDDLAVYAIVSTSPTLIATIRAAEVMLPKLKLVSAPSRSECLARVTKILRDRLRSTTGVRAKVPIRTHQTG
jgi:hypothetical protein